MVLLIIVRQRSGQFACVGRTVRWKCISKSVTVIKGTRVSISAIIFSGSCVCTCAWVRACTLLYICALSFPPSPSLSFSHMSLLLFFFLSLSLFLRFFFHRPYLTSSLLKWKSFRSVSNVFFKTLRCFHPWSNIQNRKEAFVSACSIRESFDENAAFRLRRQF